MSRRFGWPYVGQYAPVPSWGINKELILPRGSQAKKTLVGKHYFEVPSSNSLLSVLTIEGLFELTRQPLKGPQLALLTHALLPELQRYKDAVRTAVLGAEVPGHCQKLLAHILIVYL